jgi:hypothetical protein
MNGKHPIDELFARVLRDAEAAPPPAVWEGIVRKRGGASGLFRRSLRKWGLGALLLLLIGGAAGYWVLANGTNEQAEEHLSQRVLADKEAANKAATPTPTSNAYGSSPAATPLPTDGADLTASAVGAVADHSQEQTAATNNSSSSTQPNTSVAVPNSSPKVESPRLVLPKATNSDASIATVGGSARPDHAAPANEKPPASEVAKPTEHSVSSEPPQVNPNVPFRADHSKATSGSGGSPEPYTPSTRTAPDDHLARAALVSSPLPLQEAKQPGPMLPGRAIDPYVLAAGNWWFGVQLEWMAVQGTWHGAGSEVNSLNVSETWRDRKGASLVAGREWQSGWSAGLGVGVSQVRSNFVHRLVEPTRSQTVVDTTWTSIPMGQQTSYTWDIIQTELVEQGTERTYRSTNTYTLLRIAPEVSYRLWERKRFSVHGRFSPIISATLGRSGNTLIAADSVDVNADLGSQLDVLELSNPAVTDRYPLAIALSGGLDARYQLCDRLSIGILPTFAYGLSGTNDSVAKLRSSEFGAAFRFRWDLRHKERRLPPPPSVMP